MAISSVRQIPESEALQVVDSASDVAKAEIAGFWVGARSATVSAMDGDRVRDALAGQSVTSLQLAIPWDEFERNLREGLEKSLLEVMRASVEAASEMLGTEMTALLEVTNRQWVIEQARDAAAEEASSARRGLAAAALLAWSVGVDMTEATVRDVVGVQQAWSTAVVRTDLAMQDEPRRVANAARRARAESLRRASALAFAETQSRTAGVVGISQAATTAVTSGLVSGSDWVMEWVARPFGACPICLFLDGQKVDIGTPFFHPEKGSIWGLAHPNCLCSRRFVRRDQAEELVA